MCRVNSSGPICGDRHIGIHFGVARHSLFFYPQLSSAPNMTLGSCSLKASIDKSYLQHTPPADGQSRAMHCRLGMSVQWNSATKLSRVMVLQLYQPQTLTVVLMLMCGLVKLPNSVLACVCSLAHYSWKICSMHVLLMALLLDAHVVNSSVHKA